MYKAVLVAKWPIRDESNLPNLIKINGLSNTTNIKKGMKKKVYICFNKKIININLKICKLWYNLTNQIYGN